MAKSLLFQRPARQAAVTNIPGETDVDPDLLEQTSADPNSRQDYRDSNQDSRFGDRVTNVQGSLAKEATELVRWAKNGRRHIALRVASTKQVVASWWDDHIDQALLSGELNGEDMHTAAYTYASAHGLLPQGIPGGAKHAALFNRVQALTFVSPTSPEWTSFVDSLRHLPDGTKLQTLDGYTLCKDGGTFGDGDISFALEDFTGSAQHLMPPMAIQAADKDFIGQRREDGSWAVQEVSGEAAHQVAEEISEAPDGNKARVIRAPDGEAARGALHEDMQKEGITPAETTTFVAPSK